MKKIVTDPHAVAQEKALEVVLTYIEVAAVATNLFGPTVVSVKPLFKEFGRLLDDRDQGVRNETKNLIVEVYRWVGAGTKDLLKDIKPVVLNELFSCIPPEKPVRLRYLRSQKPKETISGDAVENTSEQVAASNEAPTEIDLSDMIPPSEVLSKVPKKKWQDRRDALEALEKITNVPRIVVNKDTNIMLVALAAKILGQLGRGLKSKFSPYSQQTLQACLGKFKEKKPNVVQALREAADAAVSSSPFKFPPLCDFQHIVYSVHTIQSP
ncbi:unnamed protein product [Trichobilharzia regenti]|nr:unnamed protein product [Trichobilharzia regenti]